VSHRLLISAGEPSGDQHAAALVRALRTRVPDLKCWGFGGSHLEAEGVNLIDRFGERDSVIGLEGVLAGLQRFRRRLRTLVSFTRQQGIRHAVLVDYPGFHLFLAQALHRQGVSVAYYILPQTWAWASWRTRILGNATDLRLSILPFEPQWFQQYGVSVTYVGHPLMDRIPEPPKKECPATPPVIGFFPGSRPGEIRRHLPLLQAIRQYLATQIHAEFWLSQVPGIPLDLYGPTEGFHIRKDPPLHWAHDLDLAVAASGTITLELALLGVPTVVLYRVSKSTAWIGPWVVKVRWLSLVNLLAGEPLLPEYLQRVPVEKVGAWILRHLRDLDAYQRLRARLLSLRDLLGPPGAADRAADHLSTWLRI